MFSDLGYKEGDFPNSEEASKTVLSLPMFPELKDDQVDYVVDVICAFSGF
ncbi:MAG: DegT/DnrJ/EryC1/StrS family aminotransferase [Coprothermobacter sp.]|nr:DegT/DnrJ/EryC1/StrS family aminotransferase [Coprothermobacter sp.]